MANCNTPRLDDGAPLTAADLAAHRRANPQGCSGSCDQGRGCDCVPDVEPPREPMRGADLLGLLGMVAGAWLAVAALWHFTPAAVEAIGQALQALAR